MQELGHEMGINMGSVFSILSEDLAMQRMSLNFMQKLLMMKQKVNKSNVKVSLIVSSESCTVVHNEYAPQGQILPEYSPEIIYHFHDAV